MSYSVRSGRKICKPARFIDIADDFDSWSQSENEDLESSGDDGIGKSVGNIGIDDDDLLIPMTSKVIKKRFTKSKSRVTGKVNEGAGTSTGNVHAPPFYRPDLPSPNSPPKKKRKVTNNVPILPSPLAIIGNFVNSVSVDSNATPSVSANAKAKTGKKSKASAVVYNWLDMDSPIEHVERPFVYAPKLALPKNGDLYQPIDFLNLLFDDRIYDLILAETNHYCTNCPASTPLPGWVGITKPELSAFLGIMVGSSITKIPQLNDIWCGDWTRGQRSYAAIMTKARFFEIKSHLHFNDNCIAPVRGHPEYKLHKIQPIITLCTANFRKYYQLHQEVAVDESITRFKGRNSMKQYDPSKPIKRGFKWWTLADSHSGYVYHMKMYTGRDLDKKMTGQTDTTDPPHVPVVNASGDNSTQIVDEVEEALGTRAVLSVVSPYIEHKNHVIFVDRFFSSLPLLKRLSEIGIYACGTIQKNRAGIPECIKANIRLNRGDGHFVVERDTGVQLLVWQDRKAINFINNFYPCVGGNSVKRKLPQGGGSVIKVPCPPAVLAYNRYMNGVDRADQLRQVYSIDRRSKRWFMRLFWHCLDTCISNAYILYGDYLLARGVAKKNIPRQIIFRTYLIKGLIGSFTSRKRIGRPILDPPPQPRLGPNPHKIVDLRLHGVPKRKRCVVCIKRKQRRESFYGCVQCEVSLCQSVLTNCFEVYHSKLVIE